MSLPKRLKRPRMNVREPSVIRCPGHLKWVRGHMCCLAGRKTEWADPDVRTIYTMIHVCEGRIEAHHVREGDHGQGMGRKPDDSTAVPLCSFAHKRGHDKGWKTFEHEWRVDLNSIAEQLWKASPHRAKYLLKQKESL